MKPNTDIRRAADALERAIRAQPGDLDHPDYAELEALVDGRLADADREIVEAHVDLCATCAQDVADLAGVRDAIRVGTAAEPRVVDAVRPSRSRVLQIAAAVLVVVGAGMFVRWRFAESPAGLQGPDVQTATVPAPSTTGAPALQTSGTLTPDERALVDRVLSTGQPEMPAAVRSLSRPTGTLLGPSSSAVALTPLSPVGTAVLSASPAFSWRAIPGAASYDVAVFDDRFNEVARGDRIVGTSWTPARPLPRGATLAWQITAHVGARDVLAPQPPQPEARFVVVDDATAAAVAAQQARLSDQPLELGVLLAKAGLFDDAARAFARAAAQPATADRAKALLASLKR